MTVQCDQDKGCGPVRELRNEQHDQGRRIGALETGQASLHDRITTESNKRQEDALAQSRQTNITLFGVVVSVVLLLISIALQVALKR